MVRVKFTVFSITGILCFFSYWFYQKQEEKEAVLWQNPSAVSATVLAQTLNLANKKKISPADKKHSDKFESDFDGELIENWDFEETDISPQALAPIINKTQPASIVYFDGSSMQHFYPKRYANAEAQSDKVLYLSHHTGIESVINERGLKDQNHSTAHSSGNEQDEGMKDSKESEKSKNSLKSQSLPFHSFSVVSFQPGTRDDGSILVPVSTNYLRALQGPDYSFDDFSPYNEQQMINHLSTVLPLGNSGGLIVQVAQNGVIRHTNGPDFAVYQTTFRIEGTDMFWQKFASLGVSETLDASTIKWFPCNPAAGILTGCVGVVPTDEGGDKFDLSSIGVTEAKYIWIKDIGTNFNLKSKWPTEGCAVDALRFFHAYSM